MNLTKELKKIYKILNITSRLKKHNDIKHVTWFTYTKNNSVGNIIIFKDNTYHVIDNTHNTIDDIDLKLKEAVNDVFVIGDYIVLHIFNRKIQCFKDFINNCRSMDDIKYVIDQIYERKSIYTNIDDILVTDKTIITTSNETKKTDVLMYVQFLDILFLLKKTRNAEECRKLLEYPHVCLSKLNNMQKKDLNHYDLDLEIADKIFENDDFIYNNNKYIYLDLIYKVYEKDISIGSSTDIKKLHKFLPNIVIYKKINDNSWKIKYEHSSMKFLLETNIFNDEKDMNNYIYKKKDIKRVYKIYYKNKYLSIIIMNLDFKSTKNNKKSLKKSL